jgi:hypothetical protein
MHTFEIDPLVGIGPIKFGMTRDEVRDVLCRLGAIPRRHRSRDSDTFFDSAVQVHYDGEGRAEFIETADYGAFRIVFSGHALHKLSVAKVVALVSRIAPGRWEERDHTYIVPSLQLAFWRGVTPQPAQPLNDRRGRYFEAIAAGREGYLPRATHDVLYHADQLRIGQAFLTRRSCPRAPNASIPERSGSPDSGQKLPARRQILSFHVQQVQFRQTPELLRPDVVDKLRLAGIDRVHA